MKDFNQQSQGWRGVGGQRMQEQWPGGRNTQGCSRKQQFGRNVGKCCPGRDWEGKREMEARHLAKYAFNLAVLDPVDV